MSSTVLNGALRFSGWLTKTNTYANSVDPDEMAPNEPSHLDLPFLPFSSRISSLIFSVKILFATMNSPNSKTEAFIAKTQG